VTNLPDGSLAAPRSLAGAPGKLALEVLAATDCGSATCPTFYKTDRATVVVQGYPVDCRRTGIDVPPGEFLVEIPAELSPTRFVRSPDQAK
jgi:hypothetical protein